MFVENKYTKWYFKIIDSSKNKNRTKNREKYFESHHIIPKCMGGIEKVLLTAKEHFICHLLLCRMTIGADKHKMINALIRMSFSKSNGQKRYTARSYQLVRKFIAEKNREMFKGIPKSEQIKENMRGKCGKWKRKEFHKKRMRGENNPMFGMVGAKNPATDPKVKEKISKANKGNKHGLGNKSVSGLMWVNNGTIRKMVDPNKIPEGFTKGKNWR
jgi:hypothetical protein